MVIYSVLADLVLVLHLAFIAFVVLGGFLALRWRRLVWIHPPLAVWGALVALMGWICPLTPLENYLRGLAGLAQYGGSFLERYLLPLIYPTDLTRGLQVSLGLLVVAVNLLAYGLLVRKRRHGRMRA